MNEFDLIKTLFQSLQSNRSQRVVETIGDDAAVLQVANGMELVVSTDVLVEGHHFLNDWDPAVIAYRAVACSVSDMVAMGAMAKTIVCALTVPNNDLDWLKGFAKGLSLALETFSIDLVGGDLSQGPLSIAITIHGEVAEGKAILRRNAKVGDLIYVTGELGSTGYGVSCLGKAPYDSEVFNKLFWPKPRLAYLPLLQKFANSAIDISDGLSSDLTHILKQSRMGAVLKKNQIPIAAIVKEHCLADEWLDWALHSGDEYEICFTVGLSEQIKLEQQAEKLALPLFCIGRVQEDSSGCYLQDDNGELLEMKVAGFKHF